MFEGYFRNEAALAPSPDALLRNYGRLAYPPGSVYEYSNIGFAALDAIASSLTGKDFGTLMTRRVLKPLALSDSFFDTDVARLPGAAERYDGSGRRIPYYTTSTPASGELYASARDLAQFAMFNMQIEPSGQTQILNPRWLDELHRPVFTGPSGVATTFGWFSAHLKSGLRLIFKTGGQPGVATLLCMLPSENLAWLALSNRSNGQDLTHRVCNQILSTYFAEETLPPEDAGPKPSPFAASYDFIGSWEGELINGGAKMRVNLQIDSGEVGRLAISNKPPQKITHMHSLGMAFVGTTTGFIEASDAIRNGAHTVNIKLIPYRGKLVGRLLAMGGDPDSMNSMLPYVLTLNRSSL